jgi:hypothetical protein
LKTPYPRCFCFLDGYSFHAFDVLGGYSFHAFVALVPFSFPGLWVFTFHFQDCYVLAFLWFFCACLMSLRFIGHGDYKLGDFKANFDAN